jgi:hypothetical protein
MFQTDHLFLFSMIIFIVTEKISSHITTLYKSSIFMFIDNVIIRSITKVDTYFNNIKLGMNAHISYQKIGRVLHSWNVSRASVHERLRY